MNRLTGNRSVPRLCIRGASPSTQARMVQGLPLCEQLCEQTVQQFKNNVSQHTIGKLQSGKVCCGLMSPHFKQFLEIMDVVSSGPKGRRTIQIVISAKFKSLHLWWYGGVLVPMAWVTCISVKAPLMLKGTHRFWSNICCQRSFSGMSLLISARQCQATFCTCQNTVAS